MNSFSRHLTKLDHIVGAVFRYLVRRDILVYVMMLVIVILIVGTTPFDRVLREDAFNYVLKGMQIAHSDFGLIRELSIGWPLLLGGVFWIAQVETLFEAMRMARWVSIALTGASFIPLMMICKQVLPKDCYATGCLTILIVLTFTPFMHFVGRSAMTEPLFILITLGCAMFMTFKENVIRNIVLASVMAALAYYVRPNGLFIFVAVLTAIVLNNVVAKTRPFHGVATALITFVVLCLPYVIARYMEFGSAFDYGPNSKYFVDNYEQVWADNVTSPSLFTYLATHSWSDYYSRFVDMGLLRIWGYLTDRLLPKYWILLTGLSFMFYLVKYLAGRSVGTISVIQLVILATIIGITPVFQVFGGARHLIILIPFILVSGVWGISSVQPRNWQFANVAFLILMILTLNTIGTIKWFGYKHAGTPEVKDHWAVRTAPYINGKVVIVEGGDILKMGLHYEQGEWRKMKHFVDVENTIETVRPGIYNDLSQAMEAFAAQDIGYVITDNIHIERRPYLKEIRHKKWKDVFPHMGHYKIGDRGAVLTGVDVYRIDYSKIQ